MKSEILYQHILINKQENRYKKKEEDADAEKQNLHHQH